MIEERSGMNASSPKGLKQHFNMQIDLWVSAQWDNENRPCVLT